MNKQVVRFKRETTVKDDICYEGEKSFEPITSGISCLNCRVHILTDRFLSTHFQKEVMKDQREYPNGTYPYVIIIDTSGCNYRCRACYSWIYWKPETQAMPCFVDEKTLAKQFRCKIEKLHDEELLKHTRMKDKWKRPFSRLRISGGEPLFDASSTLSSFAQGNSLNFWLAFFKNIDEELGELRKLGKINLASEKEWLDMTKEERTTKFPCFLKSDNNKIRIRFDTNGELFKNEDFAKKFIHGIYDLKLANVKIDMTFSVKGTNTYEVKWFINANTPFDATKLDIDEPIEAHPQWRAIQNIVNAIKEKEPREIISKKSENIISETYFNPCGDVSLTIERGIMQSPNEKLYLYNINSLNWDKFAAKLKEKGFELSNTQNCIYLGKYSSGTAWRYVDKGNYELRFKCPFYTEKPFLSYSKKDKSITDSEDHRKITNFKDLKQFVAQLHAQKGMVGQKCKYSDKTCDYWVEIVPF